METVDSSSVCSMRNTMRSSSVLVKTMSVLVLGLFAGLWSPGSQQQSSAESHSSARRIEVSAKRFSFDPAVITLKKDETVVVVLKSADVPHGLRCRELNLDVKVPKGGTAEVRITPHKAGEFVGMCSVFCGGGHGSMMLKFQVIG